MVEQFDQRTAHLPLRPARLCWISKLRSLSGAVASPIAGPLAAWMPPSSPQGWAHGVSKAVRHRAIDRLRV
ncbi:UNVERIFIED_CONTAM: hypothetical protein EX528_03765 [Xanthomonas axonopodis]